MRLPWLLLAAVEVLVPGQGLPPIHAKTLNGKEIVLPDEAIGHASLLVIGFSKASKDAAAPWLKRCRERLTREAGEGARCYNLRMVEGIPRLFRGMAEGGMREGYPVEFQDQNGPRVQG